jgi:cell division septation protein DedD
MGLFDKKKTGDGLRTLSEKEIQDKLYGRFRTSGPAEDRHFPFKEKQNPETQTKINTRETQTKTAGDLFKGTATTDFNTSQDSLRVEPKNTENVRPAVKQYSEYDAEVAIHKAQAEAKKPAAPRIDYVGQFKKVGIPLLKKAGALLASALLGFIKLLVFGIYKFFTTIDFRKPAIRNAAYWIGGIAVLAFIFVNINLLNIQREAAMKSPRKKTLVETAQPSAVIPTTTQTAVAEPSDSVLDPSTLSESPIKPVNASEVKSKTTPVKTSTPTEAPAVSAGSFGIQIATFATQDDAKNLVTKLSQESFRSFVKPLTRPGGRTYYCVFIGRFKNSSEADAKLAEFKKKDISKPFQDAFVRTI